MTLFRRMTLAAAAAAALAAALLAPGSPAQLTATPAQATTACPTPAKSPLIHTPATYRKTVALTFDDGPSIYTPQILAVLKKYGVHATFFQTGKHIAARPDLTRAVVASGNKLGNHTYTHPQAITGSVPYGSFDHLSLTVQASQIDSTTRAMLAAAKVKPCFFRAPGGHHFAPATVSLSRSRGMSVVHWTVSTGDWAQPGYLSKAYQDKIVANALHTSSTHVILLMHDGKASPEPERKVSSFRGNTVVALDRLIRYYKAHGYVFTDPLGRRI